MASIAEAILLAQATQLSQASLSTSNSASAIALSVKSLRCALSYDELALTSPRIFTVASARDTDLRVVAGDTSISVTTGLIGYRGISRLEPQPRR